MLLRLHDGDKQELGRGALAKALRVADIEDCTHPFLFSRTALLVVHDQLFPATATAVRQQEHDALHVLELRLVRLQAIIMVHGHAHKFREFEQLQPTSGSSGIDRLFSPLHGQRRKQQLRRLLRHGERNVGGTRRAAAGRRHEVPKHL